MLELLLAAYLQSPKLETLESARSVQLEIARPSRELDTTLMPKVDAFAYLLGDVDSGTVYTSQRQDNVLAMASLTKIMTAVVALEHYDLDEDITISADAAATPGSKVYLYAGDTLTVRELLYGLMIRSGNDVAVALAQHAPGGEEEFVAWMNEKAKQIGLKQTRFMNPTGLDDPLHYTTAYDLFLLARYALEAHPFLRDIIGRPEYVLKSQKGFAYTALSTNQLLGSFLPVTGFKTGTTERAGESYIGLIRDENGQETVLVLLNSKARFQEAKTIFWWFLRDGNVME